MLTIYLARHGQDEDNASGILNGRRDMPLTDLGRTQAATLAGKIRATKLSFDAIYSSPLQRAFETASIVAATTKGLSGDKHINAAESIRKVDDLAERDFGIMTGKPVVDISSICGPDDLLKTPTVNYFLSPEGAETFPQLKERASRALAFLNEQHAAASSSASASASSSSGGDGDDDDSILVVTHGDFGKMFYAAYYDLDWKDVLQEFHFGNSEVILCSPKISRPPSSDQTHIFSIEQFNS
eukprot:CAMPEP_0172402882 /NCGR_PEP_ID=MMETSP1061-20121228/56517_1 /TAXON_ID=37318 /ORGANISM="Pseudo-nitzschia pungens, Strain cf. pungens" /LENGTH=240 /DNA_ID=CAMNT_0013137031 /DNA_START=35 /DNA_END=757 /DNA_ORIENTATION=+